MCQIPKLSSSPPVWCKRVPTPKKTRPEIHSAISDRFRTRCTKPWVPTWSPHLPLSFCKDDFSRKLSLPLMSSRDPSQLRPILPHVYLSIIQYHIFLQNITKRTYKLSPFLISLNSNSKHIYHIQNLEPKTKTPYGATVCFKPSNHHHYVPFDI
jgi:hypothetical protein